MDGPNAALYYRGYHIDDLVANTTYEEVAYLLLHGELPDEAQLQAFKEMLANEQTIPQPIVDMLQSMPPGSVPMAMLRTAVSMLAMYDPDANDNSDEANVRKATRSPPKCRSWSP